MDEGDTPTAKELFFKTKLCKFYAAGRCDRGRRCSFAHGENRVANLPDFYRTRLCPSFMRKGSCANGSTCSYAHSKNELRDGVTKSSSNASSVSGTLAMAPRNNMPGTFPSDDVELESRIALMANFAQQRAEGQNLSDFQVRLAQNSRTGYVDNRADDHEQPNRIGPSDLQQILVSLAEQGRVPPPPQRLAQNRLDCRSTDNFSDAPTTSGRNVQSKVPGTVPSPNIDVFQLQRHVLESVSPQYSEGQNDFESKRGTLQTSRPGRSHMPNRQAPQHQMPGPVELPGKARKMQSQSSQQFDPQNLDLEQLEFLANVGARHLAGLGIDIQNVPSLGRLPRTQTSTQQAPLPRNSDGVSIALPPANTRSAEEIDLFSHSSGMQESLPQGLLPPTSSQRMASGGSAQPHQNPQQGNEFGTEVGALLELRRQLLHLSQQEGQQHLQEASAPSRSQGSTAFDAPNTKGNSGMDRRQINAASSSGWNSSNMHSQVWREDSFAENLQNDPWLAAAAMRLNGFVGSSQPADNPGVDSLIQSLQALSQREGLGAPATERSSPSQLGHLGLSNLGMAAAQKHSTISTSQRRHPQSVLETAKFGDLALSVGEAGKLVESRQVQPGMDDNATKLDAEAPSKYGMVVKNSFLDFGKDDAVTGYNAFKSQTLPNLPMVYDEGDESEGADEEAFPQQYPAVIQTLGGTRFEFSSPPDVDEAFASAFAASSGCPLNTMHHSLPATQKVSSNSFSSSASSQAHAFTPDHVPASRVESYKMSKKELGEPLKLVVKNTFLDVDNMNNMSEIAFRTASATAPELPLLFLDGENEAM